MSEYKGSIELISGITPKNNGDFPLVDSKDVLMPDGKRLSEISHFGYKYSDAISTIDISKDGDRSMYLYLFQNGDYYDAIVSGTGEMTNFSIDDGIYKCNISGKYQSLKDSVFTHMYKFHSNSPGVSRYYEFKGATAGTYYCDETNIYAMYKCIKNVPANEPSDDRQPVNIYNTEYFEPVKVNTFIRGENCVAGSFYRYDIPEYQTDKIVRLHIESGVTSIGDYFMYEAFNLKNVSFGDASLIVHLGTNCFAYTQIDGEYSFPNLLDTSIDGWFTQCPKLVGLTLNGKIKNILPGAFRMCISLKYINRVDAHIMTTTPVNIGETAFLYCTNLELLDIKATTRVNVSKYAFMNTNISARIGEYGNQNSVGSHLSKVKWGTCSPNAFTQNQWGESVNNLPVGDFSHKMPIPKSDNQKKPFNYEWDGVFPSGFGMYYGDTLDSKVFAWGSCGFYTLYHIFNLVYPNRQYSTYYDFIKREIEPRRIELDGHMCDILMSNDYAAKDSYSLPIEDNEYKADEKLWEYLEKHNKRFGRDVTYAPGEFISPVDFPATLKLTFSVDAVDNEMYGAECSAWWAIYTSLGWKARKFDLIQDGVDKTAEAKKVLLESIKANKPAMLEIFAWDDTMTYGGHAVTAIGYDRYTDKFLIIDSTWGFRSDIIPLVYWTKFETLMAPHEDCTVWTFNFGKENEEMNSEIIGLRALVSDVNRNVIENGANSKAQSDAILAKLGAGVTGTGGEVDNEVLSAINMNIEAIMNNQSSHGGELEYIRASSENAQLAIGEVNIIAQQGFNNLSTDLARILEHLGLETPDEEAPEGEDSETTKPQYSNVQVGQLVVEEDFTYVETPLDASTNDFIITPNGDTGIVALPVHPAQLVGDLIISTDRPKVPKVFLLVASREENDGLAMPRNKKTSAYDRISEDINNARKACSDEVTYSCPNWTISIMSFVNIDRLHSGWQTDTMPAMEDDGDHYGFIRRVTTNDSYSYGVYGDSFNDYPCVAKTHPLDGVLRGQCGLNEYTPVRDEDNKVTHYDLHIGNYGFKCGKYDYIIMY